MRMRNFEKSIKRDNKMPSQVNMTNGTFTLSTIDATAASIGSLTATTLQANSNAILKGVSTIATGVFSVLRIPIVAHNVSGSMWVSGNGSYFFIRAKGTTKSGALT